MATSTAEDSYVLHHNAAAELIEQVQQALFDLPAPDSGVRIDWGHVSNVGHVESQLRDILNFLTNSER